MNNELKQIRKIIEKNSDAGKIVRGMMFSNFNVSSKKQDILHQDIANIFSCLKTFIDDCMNE